MRKILIAVLLPAAFLFARCNQSTTTESNTTTGQKQAPQEIKRIDITYTMLAVKDSIRHIRSRYSHAQQAVLASVNRTDTTHLPLMDSLLIPDNQDADMMQYFGFPFYVQGLKDISKIIFFSYPTQSFGAYEHGRLVRAG